MAIIPKRSMGRATRHHWLVVTAAAAMAVLAACSSAGSANDATSTSSTAATLWLVTTGPGPANTIVQNLVSSFEKTHPGDIINLDFIENQSYKPDIQLAIDSGAGPTMFWTWGGGTLQQYIAAGEVQPLGHPSWLSDFLPSSLDAVTYHGQVYGVPVEGTQPVYFFYNKQVFARDHLTFPTTWSELLSTVTTLKQDGTIPIALAEGDQWPGLMYLEYLTDRIGGPGVANALQSNSPHAWSNPAVTKALTDIQQLVRAGAFQNGYESLRYSGGGSDTLVESGKAAMQLMGDWDISSILGSNASFVKSGNLGMAPFPTVPGGVGNSADLAGNTASYVSIASHASAKQKEIAEEFFADELTSQPYAKAEVGAGEVPVTTGASPLFAGQPLAEYDTTIYNSVRKAPSFQYSWDQAMTPAVANTLLANLSEIFQLTQTPAKFESLLNAKVAATS